MTSKKVTPESLYLKDLKKSSKYKSLDHATANNLFKKLSLSEREQYIILCRKMNESKAAANAGNYTTQKDTIGLNLKDFTDSKLSLSKWEQDVSDIIKKIVENDNVIERDFFFAYVNGVYFTKPNEHLDSYIAEEITFVKFNFKNGIMKRLVLFPDCLKISLGYRESLYEHLEESVGWRPDTFKDNETLQNCSEKIRIFFSGGYEPLYVVDKTQRDSVGVALYNLYSEIGQRCPWLHSLSDFGQHCLIYGFDFLITNLINKKNPIDKPMEALNLLDVREHWKTMDQNMATYCCERHQQHGLPNQCPLNLVLKNLYGTFLLLHPVFKEEMLNIQDIVDKDFLHNLDLVIDPVSLPVIEEFTTHCDKRLVPPSNNRWDGYVFDRQASIEEIVNGMEAIVISEEGSKRETEVLGASKWIMSGRGRGIAKKDHDKGKGPGHVFRRYKLPTVTC